LEMSDSDDDGLVVHYGGGVNAEHVGGYTEEPESLVGSYPTERWQDRQTRVVPRKRPLDGVSQT